MRRRKIFFILIPIFLVVAAGILVVSGKEFLWQKKAEVGCPCQNVAIATGEFEPNETMAFFEGHLLTPLLSELTEPSLQVMGVASEDKRIEIDLSEQKLVAWNGQTVFMETPLSSGKWYPTPTGEFEIWSKFKYTKMEGGVKGTGTYYYLPNVPYTMYFHNGFGLHGTYWHNNFGEPMSHGCVNLPTIAAEKLFYWSDPQLPQGQKSVRASANNPGTKIIIHE